LQSWVQLLCMEFTFARQFVNFKHARIPPRQCFTKRMEDAHWQFRKTVS